MSLRRVYMEIKIWVDSWSYCCIRGIYPLNKYTRINIVYEMK